MLRTITSLAMTTMPGLVIRVRSPPMPIRSTSIDSWSWVITALVKSSLALPTVSRISIRRGTSQVPTHWAVPKRFNLHHVRGRDTRIRPLLRQVPGERGQLPQGAGAQRPLHPLVQFLGGQPTLRRRVTEGLHDVVPISVRSPQLLHGGMIYAVFG